jgi:hypothetical protein
VLEFILNSSVFILLIGGLAQLVERLLCKQDVSSSSLLTSTGKEMPKGQGVP